MMELAVAYTKSLRSPYTRKVYAKMLGQYQKATGTEKLEDLLKMDPKMAQDFLCTYLVKMDEELHLAYQTRQLALAAIKYFYEFNDITLNWKKIARFLGENRKSTEDRPYTLEEIKLLLTKADERKRVIIFTLSSTGMRLGGMAELRMKHLKKIEDLYQFTVYKGTKSEYTTFCTPEAAAIIDSYLDYRRICGEKIGPESPLIRNQFNKEDSIKVAYPSLLHHTLFSN
jgi:site-specific recombinase XerD